MFRLIMGVPILIVWFGLEVLLWIYERFQYAMLRLHGHTPSEARAIIDAENDDEDW